jgi:hypothetical protein
MHDFRKIVQMGVEIAVIIVELAFVFALSVFGLAAVEVP